MIKLNKPEPTGRLQLAIEEIGDSGEWVVGYFAKLDNSDRVELLRVRAGLLNEQLTEELKHLLMKLIDRVARNIWGEGIDSHFTDLQE